MTSISSSFVGLLQPLESVATWTASSRIQNNAYRLDAGGYADTKANSLTNYFELCSTDSLGEIAQIIDFGPFKRTYIDSVKYGVPLLTSAEMMLHAPHPSIMAIIDSLKWKQYQIKRGWLLVSCSGTIGNIAVVPRDWDGWAVSQDAIRVIPETEKRGLVWAYLNLPMLRTLLISKKSGSVIDHIYREDVAALKVPRISEAAVHKLNILFDTVLDIRETASEYLHDCTEAVLSVNKLCTLVQANPLETFLILNKAVKALSCGAVEYRLDSNFYNPAAQQAVANLRRCRNVKTLGDVARIFMGPRFKRNYVESDQGVPFLSGKNIVQIRPTDLKYLSNLQMADMQELLIKRGWILITCSGTIGRTCFVWNNYEDYAASQHILRVIPDISQIDSGYLYAFLSSQYGYEQILRHRHGSVIDEVTDKQIKQVLVPLPSTDEQKAIGDKVREAYEKRAEAIRLEDESQTILMSELTKSKEMIGA